MEIKAAGPAKIWGALGALHGAAAVVAGSFAAHAFSDPRAVDLLETGARWEVASGLAAIVAAIAGIRLSAMLHVLGALVFAGALYALALGSPGVLGAVAPVGGAGMIAGWICLAISLLRART
jgi:uncharacterized membrane protein YgdD (TMEM256/DUF423 family)